MLVVCCALLTLFLIAVLVVCCALRCLLCGVHYVACSLLFVAVRDSSVGCCLSVGVVAAVVGS